MLPLLENDLTVIIKCHLIIETKQKLLKTCMPKMVTIVYILVVGMIKCIINSNWIIHICIDTYMINSMIFDRWI